MRKILAAGVMLVGLFCGSAQAMLYKWEATCLERFTFDIHDDRGPRDLGCPSNGKVRGLIRMDDAYVPGTLYDSWWGETEPLLPSYPVLSLFDPDWHLRIAYAVLVPEEFIGRVIIQLPELSGPGVVWWSGNPLNFGTGGWFVESPYPVGSWINWEDMTFTRLFQVPEPSSIALLGAGVLGLMGARRRRRV